MKVRLMTSDSVDVLAFGANSADVLKLTVKVEQAYLIKEQCVRVSHDFRSCSAVHFKP